MQNIYVIDTNVLLQNSQALSQLGSIESNAGIVIPFIVLQELDKHKTTPGEIGYQARGAIRYLEQLRQIAQTAKNINGSNLLEGVKTPEGCELLVHRLPGFTGLADDYIIETAKEIQEEARHLGEDALQVIILTLDINLRVKADAFGILAMAYEAKQKSTTVIHNSSEALLETITTIGIHEFLHEIATDKLQRHGPAGKVIECLSSDVTVFGIQPQNIEQRCALDLLLDTSVPLVCLEGVAGSGKSILACAAALTMVLQQRLYQKILVVRPVVPMGRDIGFLPGPQPLDAKILTPKGWITMGDVEVGSSVMARSGKPVNVTGVYPKGKKRIFKITTSDGRSTECCEDHLWMTQTRENRKRNKPGSIKTTREIIETIRIKGKPNHYLPRNEPIEYDAIKLPIPPYSLGVLLGDGNFGNNINFSSMDQDIVDRVGSEMETMGCTLSGPTVGRISYTIIMQDLKNNKTARHIVVSNMETGESKRFESIGEALKILPPINRATLQSRCDHNTISNGWRYEFVDSGKHWQNPIKNEISKLSLLGVCAWDKFIPNDYKYRSSVNDRISLLRGLMDTDGTIKERAGEASFCTTSLQLAKDVIEIVRSLGGNAKLPKPRDRTNRKGFIDGRTIQSRRISYEITISLPENINPFHLQRKANRHKCKYIKGIAITSIEEIGEKEAQCISVEDDEHLYLTDDFIVTHNTTSEKMQNWSQATMDVLDELLGSTHGGPRYSLDYLVESGILEVAPPTYIRGRSLHGDIIIVDEAQNLSKHEIKTLVTRVGKKSKIILTGDTHQIDTATLNRFDNGFTYLMEKFRNHPLCGMVKLSASCRSDLAAVAAMLL